MHTAMWMEHKDVWPRERGQSHFLRPLVSNAQKGELLPWRVVEGLCGVAGGNSERLQVGLTVFFGG